MKKDILKDEMARFRRERTFLWLPRIDGYVLREFLIPFSILMFAFVLLFLIADVFDDLSDFLDHDSTFLLGVKYFLLKMPGNIRFILPLTVLLSCMYTVANFGRHREITAMRASGISLFRCGRSIFAMAFLVMLVNYWFNESLIPSCTQEAEWIINTVKKGAKYEEKQNSRLQFHSPDKLRSWFIGRFDNDGVQTDVIVKFFREEEHENGSGRMRKILESVLYAESAKYDPVKKGWHFYDCTYARQFDELGVNDGVPEKVEDKFMPSSEVPETPELIEKTIVLPEALPTSEIYHILRENQRMSPNVRNVYATLFWYRLAFPWVCFMCSFLALPLAAKNERSGIFTAIVTALIVVVIYQVMTEIMMIAGKNSYLPPFIAGTFPTIAFMVYGWFFLIRKSG